MDGQTFVHEAAPGFAHRRPGLFNGRLLWRAKAGAKAGEGGVRVCGGPGWARQVPALAAGLLLAATLLPDSALATNIDQARQHLRMAELMDIGNTGRLDQYRVAERLAETALRDNPLSAEAHFLAFVAKARRLQVATGGIARLAMVFELASLDKHLDRALELDPRSAHVLAAKGVWLLERPRLLGGDRRLALEFLERAAKLNPTGAGTRLALARALVKEGRGAPARGHLLAAAHYACLTRRGRILAEADLLLRRLDSGSS